MEVVLNITINGKKENIEKCTIKELVLNKGLDPKNSIVELNREIIRKTFWEETTINDGDHIELLSIVCGG